MTTVLSQYQNTFTCTQKRCDKILKRIRDKEYKPHNRFFENVAYISLSSPGLAVALPLIFKKLLIRHFHCWASSRLSICISGRLSATGMLRTFE